MFTREVRTWSRPGTKQSMEPGSTRGAMSGRGHPRTFLRGRRGHPPVLGDGLEVIYWMYSSAGQLMRIGITRQSGGRRFGQYETDHDWFRAVATIRVELFEGTRAEAEQYETDMIRASRPPFNDRDNPDYAGQEAERKTILGIRPTMVDRAARTRLRLSRARVAAIRYGLVAAGSAAGGAVVALQV